MRLYKYFIATFLLLLAVAACKKDNGVSDAYREIPAPSEISANFDVSNDDSGVVRITPTGTSVNTFKVDFGDGSTTEEPVIVELGETIEHTYEEGTYTVKIIGISAQGVSAEYTQQLEISFRAPENLAVNIVQDTFNPSKVTVTPSADHAAQFDVFFGVADDEEPQVVMPGSHAEHTYAAAGLYTVKVVARGAGSATVEYTEEVDIPEPSDPINLPISFESPTVNYAFADFGGMTTTMVDNPDASGINTSAKVAQSVKGEGAETWAGTTIVLGEEIDFSASTTFRLKVWSPKAGATVLLKVENMDNGDIAYEVPATTTTANAWEELSFDFSGVDQGQTYMKINVFCDFNVVGDGSTFYFDDIVLGDDNGSGGEGGGTQAGFPISFDDGSMTFTDFGGNYTEIVDNPDASGINTSAKVASTTKTSGAETWAGTTMIMANALDMANYNQVKMKIWSPKAGAVILFKVENMDNGDIFHEVQATTTTANAWEELTFDFSAINTANTYHKINVFFDFGNTGDGSIYYYDDITLESAGGSGGGGGTGSNTFPIDFDAVGAEMSFSDFGGTYTEITSNPNASGLNTSANVVASTKTAGAETWAGTTMLLDAPLDLTTDNQAKIKVYSPKVGASVLFKIEHPTDGNISFENSAPTTVANEWEELTIDLSAANTANTYQKINVFFDFGNTGDGSTYYFDDIMFAEAGSTGGGGGEEPSGDCTAETDENIDPANGLINWTFQTNDAAHAFEPFGNIGGDIVANPAPDAVNPSCSVQSYDKLAGCETWSGVGKAIASRLDFTDANAVRKFSLKVFAVERTAEVTLRLEYDAYPDTEPSAEVIQSITKVGEWEELTFDFSEHTDKTFKSIIIYIDRNQPCDGALYYFDDLKQIED